jgi:flavin-dependent dehydrogenase
MDPGPHRGHAFAADSDPPMLVDTEYDAVIAGASFAGLAVAQRLGRPRAENSDTRQRRIAVLDRAPVGDGVTSACAAPVSIVHAMGAADSIRQVHDRLLIHTPSTRAVWSLPESFCTFDYRQFCQRAFECAGVDFIQASVTGRSGSIVQTTTGNISGKLLVDATGWRAVLLGGPTSPLVNRRWMAFGIESEVEGTFEPGLHFYFLPEVRDGYAWAFPAGGGIRFGVLSYLGRSKLHGALEQFMGRFGLRPGAVHGGFLASGLRSPVVDRVFVVGDASGHCLPLTGEGIRTAVLGGFKCGELLGRVLDGELSLNQAGNQYQEFTERSRRMFMALMWSNRALLALPLLGVGQVAKWLSLRSTLRLFMQRYFSIFLEAPRPLESALASDVRSTSVGGSRMARIVKRSE